MPDTTGNSKARNRRFRSLAERNGGRRVSGATERFSEEMTTMRPFVFALSTLAIASAISYAPAPAHARDYPWCAQYSERSGGGRNCGFVSLDQCRATLSGMSGICEPNPRYTNGRGYGRHDRRRAPYYRD